MKEVAVGVLFREGHVLACQRRKDVRYPLKWEFPGGKIEPGENAGQTLRRELREELGVDVRAAERFHLQEWTYPDGPTQTAGDAAFRIHYHIVREFAGEPVNRVFEEIRWVRPAELLGMDILEGNREAISLLVRDGHQARA
jgi:8-oxo-dGTP diphosphatase